MSALDDLIEHHDVEHHWSAGSYATYPAREELAKLREKAAKWDKLQADIEAGVYIIEMPSEEA